WVVMRDHTVHGGNILKNVSFFHEIVPMVRGHHERYDGKGYPDSLSGAQIPLGAQIIAIADAYDTLIHDRPYKKAMPPREAAGRLIKDSGTHFHPRVAEAFARVMAKELKEVVGEEAVEAPPATAPQGPQIREELELERDGN
ncbi:MAG: HD domain-containing protein, partial [Armatimonadetes bacterium]|nr:HD domain-containing protein [Armatimonadota bacterium]